MSSKRAKGKTTKKRPQRATSNVFAMFDQSQIQEFKEAFNMIDQNRDGFIDKEDLHDMLASLGTEVRIRQPQTFLRRSRSIHFHLMGLTAVHAAACEISQIFKAHLCSARR